MPPYEAVYKVNGVGSGTGGDDVSTKSPRIDSSTCSPWHDSSEGPRKGVQIRNGQLGFHGVYSSSWSTNENGDKE